MILIEAKWHDLHPLGLADPWGEYEAMWKASIEEPEKFWGDMAKDFHWQTPFEKARGHESRNCWRIKKGKKRNSWCWHVGWESH